MKHTVYTRLKYDTVREVEDRLALTAAFTVKAMVIGAKRCEYTIRWVFFCKERDEDRIREVVQLAGWNGRLMFNDRDDSEQIQTTLDSDDVFHEDWLRDVQSLWQEGRQSYIRYWHPIRYHLPTRKWFKPWRIAAWPSMFYSVYNPCSMYRVYARRHTQLKKLSCPVTPVDTLDRVALVVHGANVCTTIKKQDVQIKRPEGYACVNGR